MRHRPIIDAGPSLNFLSVNQERLLIGVLGPLSVPETVEGEVLNKAARDARFGAAAKVWRKLTPKWVQVLSDDLTPELGAVVERITHLPMEVRMGDPKDLGEIMVVAHAVVAAEAGQDVVVLIDDGQGARIAAAERARLERFRARGGPQGSITLASTLTVLEGAAGTKHVPDRAAMREIYRRLYRLDDGLPPIEATSLLSRRVWG